MLIPDFQAILGKSNNIHQTIELCGGGSMKLAKIKLYLKCQFKIFELIVFMIVFIFSLIYPLFFIFLKL